MSTILKEAQEYAKLNYNHQSFEVAFSHGVQWLISHIKATEDLLVKDYPIELQDKLSFSINQIPINNCDGTANEDAIKAVRYLQELNHKFFIVSKANILTAAQSKELVEKTYTCDFDEIVAKIENAAKNGKTRLHLYEPMKSTTMQKLTDLGYDIPPMPGIATQKDGLYHTIHWA